LRALGDEKQSGLGVLHEKPSDVWAVAGSGSILKGGP